MFDAYLDLGEGNLEATDILKGFASFIVVAGGGTIVGIIWGYVIGFVTRLENLFMDFYPTDLPARLKLFSRNKHSSLFVARKNALAYLLL
jgi:hypothetical protein